METLIIFGTEIPQKKWLADNKPAFISLTKIASAGNAWRILNNLPSFNVNSWLQQRNIKQYIEELELLTGKFVKYADNNGRGSQNWVHPLLCIKALEAIDKNLDVTQYPCLISEKLLVTKQDNKEYINMIGELYQKQRVKQRFLTVVKLFEKFFKQLQLKFELEHADTLRRVYVEITTLSNTYSNNKLVYQIICNRYDICK